jgi:hypothetical protein
MSDSDTRAQPEGAAPEIARETMEAPPAGGGERPYSDRPPRERRGRRAALQ